MVQEFEYLKNEFPKIYRYIVLQHKAVNSVITFCDHENQYLLFPGMFPDVNDGKGITGDLEQYFVNFLADKYNAKAFARASAYVLEDQTTFVGFDIRSVDGDVWSQQNNFEVDGEGKVVSVEEIFKNSSSENHICPTVNAYFDFIEFPEDTSQYLNDLFNQIKPNLHIIKLDKKSIHD